MSINETNGFLKRVETSDGSPEELKALLGEITGNGVVDFAKPVSEKDIYVHLGIELPKLGAEFSNKKLGKALLKEKYKKFLPSVLRRMGASLTDKNIIVDGLKRDNGLVQAIWAREKRAIYERILGFKGMEQVQKAVEMDLYGLLSHDKTKAYAEEVSKELLGDLKKCSEKQRRTMVSYFMGGALGTVFIALSIAAVATTPVTMLITDISFLAASIMMGYGDFQCFLETYKAGGPIGEYARTYVLLHFVLGVAAIVTAATLTTLTGGGFPLIALFVIGSVWMASGIGMSILLHRRNKSYDADHPTLRNFVDQVSASKLGVVYKETLEMFHKLPKLQREAILRVLLADNRDLQRHVKTLKTFSGLLPQETLGEKRRRLYREIRDQKLAERSFAIAGERLLGRAHPLDEKSLVDHPCRHIFYETFYNELVKLEQEKLFTCAGGRKLLAAAKQLFDTTSKNQKEEKIMQEAFVVRSTG